MPLGPEDIAHEQIDRMLEQAGWAVQDAKHVNLYAKQGRWLCGLNYFRSVYFGEWGVSGGDGITGGDGSAEGHV